MKISVFEIEEWEQQAFRDLADAHDVRFEAGPLDAELATAHSDADVVSTFLYSDLGADVLDRFDGLGLVTGRSTGVDHFDADWCQANGVGVANVPDYGSNRHTIRIARGFGMDVVAFDVEPDEALARELTFRWLDMDLLGMRNVPITPHTGFDTREAVERILATTKDNILAYAHGEARNRVA